MFRATRPYLSEPADPRLFLQKYRGFFCLGLYNWGFNSLKKQQQKKTDPTLPKVFKTIALNTRYFFDLPLVYIMFTPQSAN